MTSGGQCGVWVTTKRAQDSFEHGHPAASQLTEVAVRPGCQLPNRRRRSKIVYPTVRPCPGVIGGLRTGWVWSDSAVGWCWVGLSRFGTDTCLAPYHDMPAVGDAMKTHFPRPGPCVPCQWSVTTARPRIAQASPYGFLSRPRRPPPARVTEIGRTEHVGGVMYNGASTAHATAPARVSGTWATPSIDPCSRLVPKRQPCHRTGRFVAEPFQDTAASQS